MSATRDLVFTKIWTAVHCDLLSPAISGCPKGSLAQRAIPAARTEMVLGDQSCQATRCKRHRRGYKRDTSRTNIWKICAEISTIVLLQDTVLEKDKGRKLDSRWKGPFLLKQLTHYKRSAVLEDLVTHLNYVDHPKRFVPRTESIRKEAIKL